MNEDTEVYLELTDDEHEDAKTAAEDTARLLIAVRDHRRTDTDAGDESPTTDPPANGGSNDHG